MKYILAAVVFTLALAGCSKEETTVVPPADTTVTTPPSVTVETPPPVTVETPPSTNVTVETPPATPPAEAPKP